MAHPLALASRRREPGKPAQAGLNECVTDLRVKEWKLLGVKRDMQHCLCQMLDPDNRTGQAACAREEGHRPIPKKAFQVPANLSRWIEPARLRSWILEQISQLRWDNPQMIDYLRTRPDFRPRTLLAVLSYAYANALYDSEDIAEACHSRPDFQSLCDAKPPLVQDLRAFRRSNRCLIEKILAGTFMRALSFRPGSEATTPLPKWQEALDACALDRLDLARHLDHVDE